MKALLAICLIVVSTFVGAAQNPAPAEHASAVVVTGKVLEVKNAASYTYLRLKTKDGEVWAAVMQAQVKKGATVTLENVMVMDNFESKALKKTFKTILFGSLGGAAASTAVGHAMAKYSPEKMEVIKVPKAVGDNAYTVAEIFGKSASLKDKTILLRAKVVKYNPGIMGKNWIHLRDGTGSDADNSNDIIATSLNETKPGDVVTIKGMVRTDKDFGAGYAYKVIIEEAVLQK
ncbi:MAG: nucleotide-binding protein [Sideroxydans sp.]|nr:nucleotide-binding protein [Sideroxydans sp.]